MNLNWLKNGYYIPVLHILGLPFFNCFLWSTICNQLYQVNYFFWYSSHFNFPGIPKKYNTLKQYINFTYSGNFAIYVYYYFPEFLPVCHNVLFIITFSYWVGKIFYKCDDTDDLDVPEIDKRFTKITSGVSHILPYVLCLNEMNQTLINFDGYSLCYTYLWCYTWCVLIYIPWRITTGDYVYTILQHLTFKKIVEYLLTINVIIACSNFVGYLI